MTSPVLTAQEWAKNFITFCNGAWWWINYGGKHTILLLVVAVFFLKGVWSTFNDIVSFFQRRRNQQ